MHHFNYVAHKATSNCCLKIGKGKHLSVTKWEQIHQSWIFILKIKLDVGPSNWLAWPHADHLMVNWMTVKKAYKKTKKGENDKIKINWAFNFCQLHKWNEKFFTALFSKARENDSKKARYHIHSSNGFFVCSTPICVFINRFPFLQKRAKKIKSCWKVVFLIFRSKRRRRNWFHLSSERTKSFTYEQNTIRRCAFVYVCVFVRKEQYVWHSACGLIITSSHSISVHTYDAHLE